MSMTRNSIPLLSMAAMAMLAAPWPAAAVGIGLVPPTPSADPGVAPAPQTAQDIGAPDRFAQANGQYSPSPRGRPVSDHDHARQTARAGENRGFDELMRAAQSRGRGEYLGVEPDISRNVYRFKFLRSGGNVVWVDVDGRTGRVLSERD